MFRRADESTAFAALVTGASGFVGRHLVEHLRSLGDEVVETDRASGGPDITDTDGLTSLMHAARPDVVFHLAAQSDVGGSWTNVEETWRINLGGTRAVLDAARTAGVARVVVVTSADIYGHVDPAQLPIGEDTPLRPISPYAASKAAADLAALQAHLGYGSDVVRVRSFSHTGPGQSSRFVAPALAERIARNELSGATSIPVGSLDSRRDLTDVRDVVRAYRLLAVHGVSGEAYNVCRGVEVSVLELAELFVSMANHPMSLEPDPALTRVVDLAVLVGDNRRLVGATGWAPTIPIERTLSDLLTHARDQIRQTGTTRSKA